LAENAPRCDDTGEQALPSMTAKDTNRVGSDNSVSRSIEGAEIITEHDTRLRRIVRITRNSGSSTTRRDLQAKTDFSEDELDKFLQQLADGGYVDLIGKAEHEAILLTCRGEHLAGGIR